MAADEILMLIDGHNLAYRSYFALPPLTSRDGTPTQALLGFARALRQLREIWRPSHWCVAFDGGLPARRTDALPTYKAQRPSMPDDLRSQMDLIADYLDRAGIARMRVEGEEADDIIASVALRASPEAEVLVVSSDKDLCQLAGEHVWIVPPGKPGERWGPAEVVARYGVPPDRIVDMLALCGDASDNIPGVPGIGPKTSTALLKQFGSLDALWRSLDHVRSEKTRAKLLEHRADVERNLGLLRLHTADLPPIDWHTCRFCHPDPAALRPLLERLDLHSLVRDAESPTLF